MDQERAVESGEEGWIRRIGLAQDTVFGYKERKEGWMLKERENIK